MLLEGEIAGYDRTQCRVMFLPNDRRVSSALLGIVLRLVPYTVVTVISGH